MGSSVNHQVMQQHVDFFDRDGDGIISMRDTFFGYECLG